jgi:hypothetical protein
VNGPPIIIEVENRSDGNQVHIRFVISLDGPDVPPVLGCFPVLIDEVAGVNPAFVDELRDHVPAEIVAGFTILRIFFQNTNQELAVETIIAHRDQALSRVVRRGFGVRRLDRCLFFAFCN